jgi:UDP-N-acetylmuramoyl-tripeptide--D-alanyl-D-alanine ligase
MTTAEIYKLFLMHPVVETDTRKIVRDCIFFALKGENFNGNLFAAEALAKGAAYAVIDEDEYYIDKRTVLVENALQALQKLALFHRRQFKIPVLGITGSNGKTTSKELIAAVMSEKFRVTSTQGNLNNHIGVPLTLLNITPETEFAIIEMGANHGGEIAILSSLAEPDFGIITNIGKAHLEGFGSFEMIKKTKTELYDHVKSKNGTIFYNQNNPILTDLLGDYPNKVSYGINDAWLKGEPHLVPPYIHAYVYFPEGKSEVKTHLTGSYNFENIMAAACIGKFFKVEPRQIIKAIEGYIPQNNRSQLIERNGLIIIMDAYNANPASMKASIESFATVFTIPKYLILGDMLELGEQSVNEHIQVLHKIQEYHFEAVFLVGPIFMQAAANHPFQVFRHTDELALYLKSQPIKEGAVLVKGSRGIKLEKIVEFL